MLALQLPIAQFLTLTLITYWWTVELLPASPTVSTILLHHPPRLPFASRASMELPALPGLVLSSGPFWMIKAFAMSSTYQTPTMCLPVPCVYCPLNTTVSRSRTIVAPTPPTTAIKCSLSFMAANFRPPCPSALLPMWASFAVLQGIACFLVLLKQTNHPRSLLLLSSLALSSLMLMLITWNCKKKLNPSPPLIPTILRGGASVRHPFLRELPTSVRRSTTIGTRKS